jgi:hypothetical protein
MDVPEAAMNEDDFFMPRKNNIGLAGQVRPMQFVFHLQGVKHRADGNFRLGVLALDRRHAPASLGGSKNVHGLCQPLSDQVDELFDS